MYMHLFRYKRFSTFNQEDSEEVLRCLLDGLRMEEIEVTSADTALQIAIVNSLKGQCGTIEFVQVFMISWVNKIM